MPVSSSVDREAGRIAAIAPFSREASDIVPTPAARKTDVRTETQPNGSEVTTTIVEFTDQVAQLITPTADTEEAARESHVRLLLFQDHGITALSEVCYSTRQTASPVSINRRVSSCNSGSFYPRISAQRITFLLYLFADAGVCSQVHVSSLSRESAGSPILVAENVTSATTHVIKVDERAEPRLVPLLHLFEGKSFCVADGEGGILRDADREEDHNHRRRRRGPGTGTGTLHLSAHMYILIVVPCFPSGPGYCNTGSEAAAS